MSYDDDQKKRRQKLKTVHARQAPPASALHEQTGLSMLGGVTVAVIACVAGAKKFSR